MGYLPSCNAIVQHIPERALHRFHQYYAGHIQEAGKAAGMASARLRDQLYGWQSGYTSGG